MPEKQPTPNPTDSPFLKWIADNPPPDHITINITYGGKDGGEKPHEPFHFNRSIEAFDRYIRGISHTDEAGNKASSLTVASLFLMDTVMPAQREQLNIFLNAFPAHTTAISNRLLDVYSGDITIEIKNASKPAGQE